MSGDAEQSNTCSFCTQLKPTSFSRHRFLSALAAKASSSSPGVDRDYLIDCAMNGFEERPSSWYGDSSAPTELAYSRDVSWKDLGTSMSAISFGLAATAILVSMFLVMAIFEHLIKPRASFLPSRSSGSRGSAQIGQPRALIHWNHKFHSSVAVGAQYSCDFPVLMPGQQWPTFIAQPAPLPCPREGIQWPPHEPRISSLDRE